MLSRTMGRRRNRDRAITPQVASPDPSKGGEASLSPSSLFTTGDEVGKMSSIASRPSDYEDEPDIDDTLAKAQSPHQALEASRQARLIEECLDCPLLFLDSTTDLMANVPYMSNWIQNQLKHFGACIGSDAAQTLRDQVAELEQPIGSVSAQDALLRSLQAESRKFIDSMIHKAEFHFQYKHRRHRGRAVHIAALCAGAEDLLGRLFEFNADLRAECVFSAFGVPGCSQPIHLAAGCGNRRALELLLDAEVAIDIETKSRELVMPRTGGDADNQVCPHWDDIADGDVISHYTALHEASFFQQLNVIDFLLDARADPVPKNKHGQTPLHLAAVQGAYRVAERLVSRNASLEVTDDKQMTPLECALDRGTFPNKKLFLLTNRGIKDVLVVAQKAPASAAAALLRDFDADGGSAVHSSWSHGLCGENVEKRDWIEVMERAPQAAEDLLEAVTVVPEVMDSTYNPLPRQVLMWPGQDMRFHYCSERRWAYFPGQDHRDHTAWHRTFAPGEAFEHGSMEGRLARVMRVVYSDGAPTRVPVRIKVVRIADVIDIHVFFALQRTRHLHVFTKLATRAIVEYVWTTMVCPFYWTDIVYRIFEIAVLVMWVINWPEKTMFFRHFSWSLFLFCACRELYYEWCEVVTFAFMAKSASSFISAFLFQPKNVLDLLSTTALVVLIAGSATGWTSPLVPDDVRVGGGSGHMDLTSHPTVLALVAVTRWVQLMYNVRGIPVVGHKLLPIIESFMPMSGILFITLFTFLAFLHGYFALESQTSTAESRLEVFMATFRFLFLGDGDGVDSVLNLGGWRGENGDVITRAFFVMGVGFFSICILNLFIAGTNQAYDQAQEMSQIRFIQERASLCLKWLFLPVLPCSFTAVIVWKIVFFLLVVPGWILSLHTDIHPVFPSMLIFVAHVLGDAIHMGYRSRSSKGSDGSQYLWICYRSSCRDAFDWPSDSSGAGPQLEGRMSSMKRDSMLKNRHIVSEICNLKRRADRFHSSVQEEMREVGSRLYRLEHDTGARLQCIEEDLRLLVGMMAAQGGIEPESIDDLARSSGWSGSLMSVGMSRGWTPKVGL